MKQVKVHGPEQVSFAALASIAMAGLLALRRRGAPTTRRPARSDRERSSDAATPQKNASR
jgi:hypothetical protein